MEQKSEQKKGFVTYEMESGETVEMSLTFAKIMGLKSKDKELYEKVNKILTKGPEDVAQIATILYGGYICGDTSEKQYNYQAFIENMNQNFGYNVDVVKELIGSSKKQRSGKYF